MLSERISKGDFDYIKNLEENFDRGANGRNIILGIRSQNIDLIKFIYNNVGVVDWQEYSRIIIETGNIEVVEIFREDLKPLYHFCLGNSPEFLDYMLDAGLYPANENLLLNVIKRENDEDMIKIVVKYMKNRSIMDGRCINDVLFLGSIELWDSLYGNIKLTVNQILFISQRYQIIEIYSIKGEKFFKRNAIFLGKLKYIFRNRKFSDDEAETLKYINKTIHSVLFPDV